MAIIQAFRAVRYDPAKVALEQVLTQPYDKITPAMQERYYQASPYNLVRIILGKAEPGEEGGEVYARAADYFRHWRQEGILRQELEPAIYLYHQRFSAPGVGGGREMERRGFIALAAMIMGRWTPIGGFLSALLFAVFLEISQLIKIAPPAGDLGTIMSSVPAQLWDALPYILTIVIPAGVVGRRIPPAADGQPYEREGAA